MTDAEFEVQQNRIRALRDKWDDPILAGEAEVTHMFSRDYADATDETWYKTVCSARAQWQYQEASFEWNCPNVAKQDDDSLERIYVHELMHFMVNPMHKKRSPREEYVCTKLADAFLRVHRRSLRGDVSRWIEEKDASQE